MSVEENREIRPVRKKRKLRWGRLVFVLLVLAVLLTGAFWEQSGSMTILSIRRRLMLLVPATR